MGAPTRNDWRCPHCGGLSSPFAARCPQCGAGMAPDAQAEENAEKIAFLLAEMEQWRARQAIPEETYQALHQEYAQRHDELTRLPRAERMLAEARAAQSAGRREEALRKAAAALELIPRYLGALLLQADVHEQQGRLEEALRILEDARQIHSQDTDVAERVRRVRATMEAHQRAAERAQALQQVVALRDAGSIPEALAACAALIHRAPELPEAHALLADIYRAQNRPKDAMLELEQALRLKSDASWQAELRELRQAQERHDREERERQARRQAEEMVQRARKALEGGQPQPALELARRAEQLDPASAAAPAVAAAALEALRRWREAEGAWTRAARLDPASPSVQAGLQAAAAARREAERPLWSKWWEKASSTVGALMEEHNIALQQLVGAAVLFVAFICYVVLVVTNKGLWGVVGRFVVVFGSLGSTALLYWLGKRLMPTMRMTGVCLLGLASALLPVALAVVKPTFPNVVPWGWTEHGTAVGIVCLATYVWVFLHAARSRLLVTFAGAAFLGVAFGLVRSLLAPPPYGYGFVFALVGGGYLWFAHRMRRSGLAPLDTPLNVMAHVVMAGALATSLVGGNAPAGPGVWSMNTALAISLAYILVAYGFDQAGYLPVFCAVFLGVVAFGLRAQGAGLEEWYRYALPFGFVGSLFLGMMAPLSRRQQRDSFAACYEWFGLAVTAAVLAALFGRGVLEAVLNQQAPSGPELRAGLATSLTCAVFYALASRFLAKPAFLYGSLLTFTYASILAVLWLQRPVYEYPVWLILLAAGMIGTGRRIETMGQGEFARPLRGIGQSLLALCALASVALWFHRGVLPGLQGTSVIPGYREAAWVALLLAMGLYALSAAWTSSGLQASDGGLQIAGGDGSAAPRTRFVTLAVVAGVFWWGAGCSWLDERVLAGILGSERNYGLYYLPFAALLAMAGHVLRSRGVPGSEASAAVARPCEQMAFLVAAGAAAAQGYPMATAAGLVHSVWITLLLCAGGFAWMAVARRMEEIPFLGASAAEAGVYFSAGALWVGFFYALERLGVHREVVAMGVLLGGSVGASLLVYHLESRAKRHWSRALLGSAGAVFAAACCRGLMAPSPVVAFVAAGILALYLASVYGGRRALVVTSAVLGFGAAYVLAAAVAFFRLQWSYPNAPADALALAGCSAAAGVVYSWLSLRLHARRPAYIATLTLAEAVFLALFVGLGGVHTAGLQRLSVMLVSILLLLTGRALARRKQHVLAEAPFVVGYALSAVGVLVAAAAWMQTFSPTDRLVAIAATGLGAGIYAVSAAGFRSRWFVYPAGLTAALAYGLAGLHWAMPRVPAPDANWGLWFLPLVAVLAVLGDALHRRDAGDFGRSLHHVAAPLILLSLLLQGECRPLTVCATLFGYALLFAWATGAAPHWKSDVPAGALCQALATLGASSFAGGWMLLFEHLGQTAGTPGALRPLAGVTGLLWCFVALRISDLGSTPVAPSGSDKPAGVPSDGGSAGARDAALWATPLFAVAFLWSVLCLAWAVAPTVPPGSSGPVLPLLALALGTALATWMASRQWAVGRRQSADGSGQPAEGSGQRVPGTSHSALRTPHSRIGTSHSAHLLGYWGAGSFALGHLWLYFHSEVVRWNAGAMAAPSAGEIALSFPAGVSIVAAGVCMGWLARLLRSTSFAALGTFAFAWAWCVFLAAGIGAAGTALWGTHAIGLALLAAVLLAAGHLLRRRGWEDLSSPPLQCSDLFAAVAALAALAAAVGGRQSATLFGPAFPLDDRILSAVAMALVAGVCASSAWLRRLPAMVYGASVAAIVGWEMLGASRLLAVQAPRLNHGLFTLAMVVALDAAGRALRRRGQDEFSRPAARVAFLLSLGCFASQAFALMVDGARPGVAVTLLALAALYAFASYLERSAPARVEALTYLSCAALASGLACLLVPLLPVAVVGFIAVAVGVALAALGFRISDFGFRTADRPPGADTPRTSDRVGAGDRRGAGDVGAGRAEGRKSEIRNPKSEIHAGPLKSSGAILALLGTAVALLLPDAAAPHWSVGAVALAAALYACMALLDRDVAFAHLSAGVVLGGHVAFLAHGMSVAAGGGVLLLPVLAAALLAPALALALESGKSGDASKSVGYWSPVLLATAFVTYGIAFFDEVASPPARYAALFAVAMGGCAYAYRRLAQRFGDGGFDMLCALTGALGYWHALALAHVVLSVGDAAWMPDPARTVGFALLPYLAFLIWLQTRDGTWGETILAQPYGRAALLLSVAGLVGGIARLGGRITETAALLFLYALAYGGAAFVCRSVKMTTCAAGVATAGWVFTAWRTLPANAAGLPEGCQFGFWTAVLGALWLCGALALNLRDGCRPFAAPLFGFAGVLATVGGLVGWLEAAGGGSFGLWAVAGLALAVGVHAVLARVHDAPVLVYSANGLFALGWHAFYVARGWPAPSEALPIFGCWFAGLGVVQVGAGLLVEYALGARPFARPLYGIGVVAASAGALLALAGTPSAEHLGVWTVGALLLSTVAHTAMAGVFRNVAFVHAGFAGIAFSLFLFFYGQLKLGITAMPNVYALPVGIYLLLLPAIHRHVGRDVEANPFYSAGLVLLLGSGAITLVRSGWENVTSFLLLIESVAAFLYGLGRRRRVFFAFGGGFIALWAGVLVYDVVILGMRGGWLRAAIALAVVVGGGLIISGAIGERKGVNLLRAVWEQAQAVRDWE